MIERGSVLSGPTKRPKNEARRKTLLAILFVGGSVGGITVNTHFGNPVIKGYESMGNYIFGSGDKNVQINKRSTDYSNR